MNETDQSVAPALSRSKIGFNEKFRLHPNGLEVIGEPTLEDCIEAFPRFARLDASVKFGLGDLINYGEDRFGEAFSQAYDTDGFDYAPSTLHNISSVAKKIPADRRRFDLSWNHYAAVAYLEPPIADELLEKAAANRLPVSGLREAVRTYRGALREGKTTDVGKLIAAAEPPQTTDIGGANLSGTLRRLAAKSLTWERLEYEAWKEGRLAEHHSEVMRQLQPVRA